MGSEHVWSSVNFLGKEKRFWVARFQGIQFFFWIGWGIVSCAKNEVKISAIFPGISYKENNLPMVLQIFRQMNLPSKNSLESALSTFFIGYLFESFRGSGTKLTTRGVPGKYADLSFIDHWFTVLKRKNSLKAINQVSLPKENSKYNWIPNKWKQCTCHFIQIAILCLIGSMFRKNPFVDDIAWRCFYNRLGRENE